ncbi:hypothetical protein I3842_16G014800 [Carya illinoinensis]|uniref:Uncharacterized protein n=1 Tax=Carya illinoinensis TaxID=32201 RepID=A0A922A5Y0_CARIL|nr:hypothetical protein I3842_16G014800 [Carya illinoinensis]
MPPARPQCLHCFPWGELLQVSAAQHALHGLVWRFYVIGSDRNKRFFRVLKIDCSELSDLNISEDPVVYSPKEIKNLLQRIDVFGIVGCITLLKSGGILTN